MIPQKRSARAFVVSSAAVEFRRPARFNGALGVAVEPAEPGASRIVLAQRVLRGDQDLVIARVAVACVTTASARPARIPRSLVDRVVRQAP
jgi:acyl-CoA thioester hydrolase